MGFKRLHVYVLHLGGRIQIWDGVRDIPHCFFIGGSSGMNLGY